MAVYILGERHISIGTARRFYFLKYLAAMAADEPADGGDVDDRTRAAAGVFMHSEERLDAMQGADDVDVEGVTELLGRHV